MGRARGGAKPTTNNFYSSFQCQYHVSPMQKIWVYAYPSITPHSDVCAVKIRSCWIRS